MARQVLLNYSTIVEATRTVGEIETILSSHGAKSVLKEWDKEGQIAALSFQIDSPRGELSVRIPIKIEAIMKILWRKHCAKPKLVPLRSTRRPQAVRIAWRIAKNWVEVQMSMLEMEQAEISEIFLPYLMAPGGKTFFEVITERNLLPAGKGELCPS